MSHTAKRVLTFASSERQRSLHSGPKNKSKHSFHQTMTLKKPSWKNNWTQPHGFGPFEFSAGTLLVKKKGKKRKTDQEGHRVPKFCSKKDIFPQTELFLLHNLCLQNTLTITYNNNQRPANAKTKAQQCDSAISISKNRWRKTVYECMCRAPLLWSDTGMSVLILTISSCKAHRYMKNTLNWAYIYRVVLSITTQWDQNQYPQHSGKLNPIIKHSLVFEWPE